MTTRYILQRAITGQVLTYQAPGVTEGDRTRALSAVDSLTVTITADDVAQTGSDGEPLYQEWGTILTVEEDRLIRFRGLVIKMTYGDPAWTIELASIATYLHDTPFEGQPFYGAQVDPADVVRLAWAHAQSFPDSDLGVEVLGSTPVRIGSFSTQNKADTLAAYTAATKAYDAENATLKQRRAAATDARSAYSGLVAQRAAAQSALTAAKKTKDPAQIAAAQAGYDQAVVAAVAQQRVIDARQAEVDAQARTVAARKATKDAAYTAKVAAAKAAKDDGGAYTLLWWELPDLGQAVDELAKAVPFDWAEEHYWDGDRPATRIRILYPRAGRRLEGPSTPSFVQGVNISQPVVPESAGDDFANTVFGVGAGEGPGSIRRSIGKRNGRLRRVASFTAKDVKTNAEMERRLRAELTARQETLVVQQITVADHENSPRGSYGPGDDIFVQARVPHYGRFELWHRILKITDRPDGTSVLDLARTDSFTYGRGID